MGLGQSFLNAAILFQITLSRNHGIPIAINTNSANSYYYNCFFIIILIRIAIIIIIAAPVIIAPIIIYRKAGVLVSNRIFFVGTHAKYGGPVGFR